MLGLRCKNHALDQSLQSRPFPQQNLGTTRAAYNQLPFNSTAWAKEWAAIRPRGRRGRTLVGARTQPFDAQSGAGRLAQARFPAQRLGCNLGERTARAPMALAAERLQGRHGL